MMILSDTFLYGWSNVCCRQGPPRKLPLDNMTYGNGDGSVFLPERISSLQGSADSSPVEGSFLADYVLVGASVFNA
jgi:hypothetical protein